MKISKERKKELRKIYEKKKGEEWVKWIQNHPTYTSSEWVDYLSKGK